MIENRLQEFYDFLVKNEKKIKRAIRKNTTRDEDVDFVDEVYQDAVIKVAERIIDGVEIENYLNYMFLACRNNYIARQNAKRKMQQSLVDAFENLMILDDDDTEEEEERFRKKNNFIIDIKMHLIEKFGLRQAQIWLDYVLSKAISKKTTYAKLAENYQTSVNEIREAIHNCQGEIDNNEQLKEKYNTLKHQ